MLPSIYFVIIYFEMMTQQIITKFVYGSAKILYIYVTHDDVDKSINDFLQVRAGERVRKM